jgi:Meiotically Up-regulated Gene 113 (MUG113) protein
LRPRTTSSDSNPLLKEQNYVLSTEETTIYLLGQVGGPHVKIGHSTNPKSRIRSIQTMSPTPIDVLWTHPGRKEHETLLHRAFAAYRQHGEWFDFGNLDPVAEVAAAMANLVQADEAEARVAAERAALPGTLVKVGRKLWIMRGDGQFQCVDTVKSKRRCRNYIFDVFDDMESRKYWAVPGVGVIEGYEIPVADAGDEERVMLQLCAIHYDVLLEIRYEEKCHGGEPPLGPLFPAVDPMWEPFDLARHANMVTPRRYGQDACSVLPGLEHVEMKLTQHLEVEARRLAFELLPPEAAQALRAHGAEKNPY